MTKTPLIVLLNFFICTVVFAQSKPTASRDSVAFYMHDKFTMAQGQGDAQFLRLIVKAKGGIYEVQDYYPDGTLRLLAHTTVQQVHFEQSAHGIYTEYYRNGNKKLVRRYDLGNVAGDDTTFYSDGQLYNVVSHRKGGDYLRTCFDSTGKTLADNGNGTWVKGLETDEGETSTGPVIDGKEDGLWIYKYTGDAGLYKVAYKNGLIVAGTDSRPVTREFTTVNKQPSYGNSDPEFNRYLSKAVRYPKYARENNITGRVIVTFIVEKDGSLTDVKVLSSPHESLSEEALRVIKASTPWKPGTRDGKPVRVQYSVPVAFALANDN